MNKEQKKEVILYKLGELKGLKKTTEYKAVEAVLNDIADLLDVPQCLPAESYTVKMKRIYDKANRFLTDSQWGGKRAGSGRQSKLPTTTKRLPIALVPTLNKLIEAFEAAQKRPEGETCTITLTIPRASREAVQEQLEGNKK